MTIGKKLYAGFGTMLAITLLVAGFAIRNVGSLGEDVTMLGHHYLRTLYLTGDINNLTTGLVSHTCGILLGGHMNDLDKAREHNAHYASEMDLVRHETAEFIQTTKHEQLRQIAQERILDKLDRMSQENSAMYELVMKGDLADADTLFRDKLFPLLNEVSDSGDQLAKLGVKPVNSYADTAIGTVAPARFISIVMICLSIVVGAVIIYVVRGITQALGESITELRDGADQVASAASQVSSSSQSLAQGASEQAASLEETSAASEEINSMARKNTDNSRSTAQLLAQSQGKVTLANQHLTEMVISMNEITESSGKISKIIKVIDEIAFQTNILALNAAVEAARAGEAGMGFAVVADEVRSLAQRSAQAAKDTASLIEDSIARSSEGKGKVDQVATAIRAVTEDSARVKVMVDEVSLGSEEQSRGIDQIGKAIAQMDQVTQTTAANAEEAAAAAEQLNAQSETMKDVVARLQAMVDSTDTEGMRATHRVAPARTGFSSPRAPRPSVKQHIGPPQTSGVRTQLPPGFANGAMKGSSRVEEFPLEENFQSF